MNAHSGRTARPRGICEIEQRRGHVRHVDTDPGADCSDSHMVRNACVSGGECVFVEAHPLSIIGVTDLDIPLMIEQCILLNKPPKQSALFSTSIWIKTKRMQLTYPWYASVPVVGLLTLKSNPASPTLDVGVATELMVMVTS